MGVFSNHVHTTEFTTGGLQSRCKEKIEKINGRIPELALASSSSSVKGSEYSCRCKILAFLLYILCK